MKFLFFSDYVKRVEQTSILNNVKEIKQLLLNGRRFITICMVEHLQTAFEYLHKTIYYLLKNLNPTKS